MKLNFANKPLVMAILNATPDSFSDGGEISDQASLQNRVSQVVAEGADIIDIGGESSRPGFAPISAEAEIKRIIPVIQAVRAQNQFIPISIDTQKATVAEAALKAGANIINDISALSDPKMSAVAKKFNCPIILMRNIGIKKDVIPETKAQFQKIISAARFLGLDSENIILDPGLGFGDLQTKNFSKLPGGNVKANMKLVQNINQYSLGYPVLIGGSRKRFIGEMMNQPDPKKRLLGSLDVAVQAAQSGASIIRVHDVKATIKALKNL